MDIDHSVTTSRCAVHIFDIGQDNGGRGWLGKVGVGGDYQFAGRLGWVAGVFADGSSPTSRATTASPAWALRGRISYRPAEE